MPRTTARSRARQAPVVQAPVVQAPVVQAPPLDLPLRLVAPPRPVTAALLVFGTTCVALSTLRPKALPVPAQRVADGVTLTVLTVHPVEAWAFGRWLRRRDLTPGTRRRAQLSVLVLGLMGLLPAWRATRRAALR